MNSERPRRPAWFGFLIGLLAIGLPIAGVLGWQQLRHGRRTEASPPRRALSSPAVSPTVDSGPIDEADLVVSGASIADPTPPPSTAALRAACGRAQRWLERVQVDPFAGNGVDSLRLFALEVECWDRIARAQAPGPERSRAEGQLAARLRRVCDARRLRGRFEGPGGSAGLLDALFLVERCKERGLDPEPLVAAIRAGKDLMESEIGRMPPSMAMFYSSAMERAGIAPGIPSSSYRSAGMLAARPREVTMNASAISALVAEIFAASDGGRASLERLQPAEESYLHRVLPHLAMTATLFRRLETAADLLSCLNTAHMTETYGYREGLRTLVERQNPDGSFGDSGAPGGRARVVELLAPTTAAVTAMSLELRRAGEVG